LWVARTVAQQAIARGTRDTRAAVAAMIARFAHATRGPALHFDAAILYASSGDHEAALRHLEHAGSGEPFDRAVAPAIAISNALSGRHAEAVAQLEALGSRDLVIEYAHGIALRGIGRTEDALHLFERILVSSPGHAGALQQAALCCYALNRKVEGNR